MGCEEDGEGCDAVEVEEYSDVDYDEASCGCDGVAAYDGEGVSGFGVDRCEVEADCDAGYDVDYDGVEASYAQAGCGVDYDGDDGGYDGSVGVRYELSDVAVEL